MTALLASGQHEWKSLGAVYHGNSLKGLTVAVAFHIVLIAIILTLTPTEKLEGTRRIIADWWPPPGPLVPIGTPIVPTKIAVGGGHRATGKGVPVPANVVDEIEEYLNAIDGSGSTELDGSGIEGEGMSGSEGTEESGFPGGVIDLTKDWTGSLEKYPIPIRQVKPEYPDLARRLGIEGTVTVKILIDKNGKPEKAEIYKGVNELLNEAAMQAALKWLFVPAVMNNNTVAVWVAVPFRFRVVER